MIEFIFISQTANLLLFAVMGMCAILHIINVALNGEHAKKLSMCCEIVFVVYLAVLTIMPLVSAFDKRDGLINVEVYNNLSYVCGVLCVIVFAVKSVVSRRMRKIVPLVTVLITLPYVVALPFGLFTFAYVASSVVLAVRGVALIAHTNNQLQVKSVNLMISQGIDTLDSGILFCNDDGYAYLCNEKMQGIMLALFGHVHNNGELLWNDICHSQLLHFDREIIGNEVLLRRETQTLKCQKNSIKIKNKGYYEIICSDITKLDERVQQLKKSQNQLLQQEKELLNLTDKMIELSIAKEHARLRMALHDDFGQRLTLLQRIVGSNDADLFENAENLLDSMQNIINGQDNGFDKDSIDSLLSFFSEIDINVQLHGSYPESTTAQQLLFYSLRECTINAVKHAGATTIDVTINDNCITITNDGTVPQSEIVEGSGLQALRARAVEVGATLVVESYPQVKIVINLGEQND